MRYLGGIDFSLIYAMTSYILCMQRIVAIKLAVQRFQRRRFVKRQKKFFSADRLSNVFFTIKRVIILSYSL